MTDNKDTRPDNGDAPLGAGPNEVERTLDDSDAPETPSQFLEKTQGGLSGDLNHTDSHDTTSTITSFGDSEEVPELLLDSAATSSHRFDLREQVGSGATSRVFAMHDYSLDRTVAVKFLRRRRGSKTEVRDRFLHEARVTASLQHPNIMPIYDIGVNAKGDLYFSMKKIEGCSLGDAIKRAQKGKLVPGDFATIDGRVRIFLKVCDALTFAHSRGFVHQDVKPDNIMLGEFGEVLLVDWGSARREHEPIFKKRLFGTLAYMSPEQAERRDSTHLSDVYCLGATFFHALLLRHPVWDPDPEKFWQKKRRGYIDEPTRNESRGVPAALLAIARKALEPEPAKRYQSVDAFAQDLKHWQAGLAVSAHRESLPQRFRRWYGHNQRIFWTASLLSSAVVCAALLLFQEKIKEMVTWRPFYTESFAYASPSDLSHRWTGYSSRDWINLSPEPLSESGAWRVDSGALTGDNVDGIDNIAFRQPIPGDIRVEWEVTALRHALNLNCFIAGNDRMSGYTFHVGGWGDPRRCVLTRLQAVVVDEALMDDPLTLGKTYAMRMEREGKHVRLFMNGRKVLDYRDAEDLHGPGHQSFGFEVNNTNAIRIGNVRVFHHPLPLKVSPIVTADRFYEQGLFAEARSQYLELMETYPQRDIAVGAEFKAARCLLRLDSVQRAEEAFELFDRRHPRNDLAPLALHERARLAELRRDTAASEQRYRELGARFPGHSVLRSVYFAMTNDRILRHEHWSNAVFRDSAYNGHLGQWLWHEAKRLRDLGTAFGLDTRDNEFINAAVDVLANLEGVPVEELREAFPAARRGAAQALLAQTNYEEILARYPDCELQAAEALYMLGEYEKVLSHYPEVSRWCGFAALRMGDAAAALQRYRTDRNVHTLALAQTGAYDELLNHMRNVDSVPRIYAYRTGRLTEYLASPDLGIIPRVAALCDPGGRPDSALPILAAYPGAGFFGLDLTRTDALMEAGRFEEARSFCCGKPSHEAQCGDALQQLGRIEEAAALLPFTVETQFMALLHRGEFDAFLARFPLMHDRGIAARWLAGRHEDILKAYPRRAPVCAQVMLSQHRYAEVLQRYPRERASCARALVALGRYDEVLAGYPDCRDECADALIAQGHIDKALERYPESRKACAQQLLLDRRFAEVVDRFADQTPEYAEALIRLDRAEEAPIDRGLFRVSLASKCDLLHLIALEKYIGQTRRTGASLAPKPHTFSSGRYFAKNRFAHFLLEPVLAGLRGDTTALTTACRTLMNDYQYRFGQQLWYEAAYLCGAIGDDAFVAQPWQLDIAERHAMVRALRSDLQGDTAAAAAQYDSAMRVWLEDRSLPRPEDHEPLLTSATARRFVQWRLNTVRDAR
jgi:serine/threonine protein kinase/tetratricopeptide (TPR) repeat protein